MEGRTGSEGITMRWRVGQGVDREAIAGQCWQPSNELKASSCSWTDPMT